MKGNFFKNPYFNIAVSFIFILVILVLTYIYREKLLNTINTRNSSSETSKEQSSRPDKLSQSDGLSRANELLQPENTQQSEETGTGNPRQNGFYKSYNFDEIGLALTIPEDYTVSYSVMKIEETGISNGFNITVQNHDFTEETKEDYFQLYSIYQTDGGKTDYSVLKSINSEFVPGTYKETALGGRQVVEGLFNGERQRYAYNFLHDGYIFKLALANPTELNKKIAEDIITSLKFENNN